MTGVLVNTVAILLGGALGLLLGKRIPKRVRETVMQGLALCVVLVGLLNALKTQDMLCVILCMVVGALLGEWMDIEARLARLGGRLERLAARGEPGALGESTFVEGFVTASLVFCVGAMAVVGALESGLSGNHTTLIVKSIMDGVGSVFFAAALGPGVLLSGVAVLLYQGLIALGAGFVAPLMTEPTVLEMSAIGGLIIAAIGLNMLEAVKVRIGNLLPAIFLPLLYLPLAAWVKGLLGA